MLTQHDADQAVLLSQQSRKFQDALTRHDHLVTVSLLDLCSHGTHRKTMPIGCDRAQNARLNFKQHAVEVVANVLLGHGKASALDQAAQLALNKAERKRTRTFFHSREVIGRQGRKRKAAATRFDNQLLLVELDVNQCVIGNAFADVHQLARGDGDFARLSRLFQLHAADQLDFEVRTGQRQLLALNDQKYVRKNRQGLTAFDNARDQLQGFQQGFALNGEMHGLVPCLDKLRQRHVVNVRSRFL